MHKIKLFFVILLIGLSACTHLIKHEDPRLNADRIRKESKLTHAIIKTKSFNITSYSKDLHQETSLQGPLKSPLTIYIEGDGHAWINRYQISNDPTPHNPLALKLAVLDPNPNVVYLARPCQYTDPILDTQCHPDYWTTARFSETVISAMNEAVEHLKQKTKAKKIHLVGFSGGAAVAILIAGRRQDIASIRTVAGDLDHAELSRYHKTTPLTQSLNPKEVIQKIAHIPQHHFVGDKDPIVPLFLSQNFINEIEISKQTSKANTNTQCAKRTVLKNVTHHQGWEERWVELLEIPITCNN